MFKALIFFAAFAAFTFAQTTSSATALLTSELSASSASASASASSLFNTDDGTDDLDDDESTSSPTTSRTSPTRNRTSAFSPGITTSSISAQTTIQAIVGSITTGYAGSIISANPCLTTLALVCTDSYECGVASGLTITITQGPSSYILTYATSTLGSQATIIQECALSGPSASWTRAICTVTLEASADGEKSSTKTTSTISGSADVRTQFGYAQVPVTAGGELLAQATAACTASAGGASGARMWSVKREVWKVLVPLGGAAVGGGLGLGLGL